jgi:hypothetical protein
VTFRKTAFALAMFGNAHFDASPKLAAKLAVSNTNTNTGARDNGTV